jgi:hypothetical protein
MRRSWVARCFASLFAVWFAVSLAEPAMLHACPMHGAHAGGQLGAPDAHALHRAHGAGDVATHDTQRVPHPASHCTCLGSCTASSSGAVLPTTAALLPHPLTFSVAPPVHAVVARVITRASFLLPYANGPPAHASIA